MHFLVFLAHRSPPLHTLKIEGDVREDEILESLRLTPSLKHLNPDSINSGRVADVFFCAPARNNGSNMSKDEVLPKLETLGLRASKIFKWGSIFNLWKTNKTNQNSPRQCPLQRASLSSGPDGRQGERPVDPVILRRLVQLRAEGISIYIRNCNGEEMIDETTVPFRSIRPSPVPPGFF